MVRYKKRYLVLQLDNFNQVFHNSKFCHQVMDIRDDALIEAIKSIVEELHGDNGRATVATGLRTIYCNSGKVTTFHLPMKFFYDPLKISSISSFYKKNLLQ